MGRRGEVLSLNTLEPDRINYSDVSICQPVPATRLRDPNPNGTNGEIREGKERGEERRMVEGREERQAGRKEDRGMKGSQWRGITGKKERRGEEGGMKRGNMDGGGEKVGGVKEKGMDHSYSPSTSCISPFFTSSSSSSSCTPPLSSLFLLLFLHQVIIRTRRGHQDNSSGG